MSIDFSALLLLLMLVSGAVWLLGVLFFIDDKRVNEDGVVVAPVIVDYARSFFPIFVIVFLLRSFLVEPFRIPSNSMMPTLLTGDFILVNKYDYGLRMPLLNVKLFEIGAPERGDVVVFRYPKDPKIPYIKRVLGLPGDEFLYLDKMLYINGEPVQRSRVGRYSAFGSGELMDGAVLASERLDNGSVYETLSLPNVKNVAPSYVRGVVPEGHYFVLGDNRDNSRDSRYWGFVPDQNLVGRAFMVWMNWDRKNEDNRMNISRIGMMISKKRA